MTEKLYKIKPPAREGDVMHTAVGRVTLSRLGDGWQATIAYADFRMNLTGSIGRPRGEVEMAVEEMHYNQVQMFLEEATP